MGEVILGGISLVAALLLIAGVFGGISSCDEHGKAKQLGYETIKVIADTNHDGIMTIYYDPNSFPGLKSYKAGDTLKLEIPSGKGVTTIKGN